MQGEMEMDENRAFKRRSHKHTLLLLLFESFLILLTIRYSTLLGLLSI